MIGRITTEEITQSDQEQKRDKLSVEVLKLGIDYDKLKNKVEDLQRQKLEIEPVEIELNSKKNELTQCEEKVNYLVKEISGMEEQIILIETKKIEYEKYVFSNNQLELTAEDLKSKINFLNSDIIRLENDVVNSQAKATFEKENIINETGELNKEKHKVGLEVDMIKSELTQLVNIKKDTENEIMEARKNLKDLSDGISGLQSVQKELLNKTKELEDEHIKKSKIFTEYFKQKENEVAIKTKKLQEIEGAISLKENNNVI